MKSPLALVVFAVLVCAGPAFGAEAPESPQPFRVLPTPGGCAITFDNVPDEYRIDTRADGSLTVTFAKQVFPPQERQLTGACVSSFRVSTPTEGTGSTVALQLEGYELGAVIRSSSGLKIAFEKAVDLSTSASGSGSASASDKSYRIGVGDQLEITVYQQPDLTKKIAVGADGTIDYPLLGAVKAAGKSVRGLQEELTADLGKEFIVNPQVTVEVASYKSQFVFVGGQVRNPGKYPLEGGTTLKDAIALAGGLLPEAGYSITVARRSHGPDGTVRDPEKMAYSRGDIESGLANLDLKPNDVVTIAEKDYVYFQGEVHKPGRYELRPGLTLMQAISLAEGLTDWADRKEILLYRKVGTTDSKQTINYKNVEKQKAPDVPLAPGDTVVVSRRVL
jgi:polysaccharide export outer membrane protein